MTKIGDEWETDPHGLSPEEQRRLAALEQWQSLYDIPLHRLVLDQDYRDRYYRERGARWKRVGSWVTALASVAAILVVVAAAIAFLVRLL